MRRWCSILVFAACTPRPGLEIERVVPASGRADAITPISIEGSGFRIAIRSDIDDGTTTVDDRVSVWLDEIALDDTTWRGDLLVEALVPANLAAKTYDVTVALGERSGILREGFTIGPRSFDPATDCPPDYTTILPSSPSRYRIVQTTDIAWRQYPICNGDLPGRTHAIVLGSMQEIVELDAVLDAMNGTVRFWAGGVQSPTATTVDGDWIAFDGTPLIATAWHLNEDPPEPNDLDGSESDHGQQLLMIDRDQHYLQDAIGDALYGIVCECDGVPIHPTAQMYFDLDPNNPN